MIFRNGSIFVGQESNLTSEVFGTAPRQSANGGNKFREVNKKVDAEKELAQEFLVTDAVAYGRDTEITDLFAVALYFK